MRARKQSSNNGQNTAGGQYSMFLRKEHDTSKTWPFRNDTLIILMDKLSQSESYFEIIFSAVNFQNEADKRWLFKILVALKKHNASFVRMRFENCQFHQNDLDAFTRQIKEMTRIPFDFLVKLSAEYPIDMSNKEMRSKLRNERNCILQEVEINGCQIECPGFELNKLLAENSGTRYRIASIMFWVHFMLISEYTNKQKFDKVSELVERIKFTAEKLSMVPSPTAVQRIILLHFPILLHKIARWHKNEKDFSTAYNYSHLAYSIKSRARPHDDTCKRDLLCYALHVVSSLQESDKLSVEFAEIALQNFDDITEKKQSDEEDAKSALILLLKAGSESLKNPKLVQKYRYLIEPDELKFEESESSGSGSESEEQVESDPEEQELAKQVLVSPSPIKIYTSSCALLLFQSEISSPWRKITPDQEPSLFDKRLFDH